jgi:RNA polymerase sigma-70 factor (ECF subfamily)
MSMMGPEQLGLLIDGRGPALVLYARQWCSAPEDVVQTAFLRLSNQRQAPAEPLPWLFRAVRNAAMSAGRAERRRRHYEGRAAASAPTWFAPAEASRLDAATATEALARLPLEQREVIVAHLWGGLTFDRIGPLIGSSAATAHRRYVDGLQMLRDQLGEPCPTRRRT